MNFLRRQKVKANIEPQLPPEVWITIFEYLKASELLQVRLTCRYWNRLIIGTPSLAAKFVLRFRGSPNSKQIRTLATSTLRHSRVSFVSVQLIDVSRYWSQFGENCSVLSFYQCYISDDSLWEILQQSPRIKVLDIGPFNDLQMSRNPELNFRLPSLEKLTLGRLKNSDMLETFRKLCPRLKQLELSFLGKHRNENVTDHVVEFIQNVSETLQILHIVEADEDVLSAILNIEKLQLKRLKVLSPLGEASLINLNCKQPTIETLEIGFIDSTEQLIQLGISLPGLTTFSVHLNERHLSALSFLTSMPAVTWLTVRFCACSNLALDRHTPAKQNHLARLTLLAAQYTLSWIAQFPHLRTLELTDCCVESWNEFCVQIVGIEHLQSLKLVEVMSKRKVEVVPVRLEKLCELRMRACVMSGEELKNFVLSGSNLEKLFLEQMPALDDNVALVISQSLEQLRVLHFARCKNITKIAIDHINDSRCGADILKFSIDV